MNPEGLRSFAESNSITCIGWFKACSFPKYLQAIEERREYHVFEYRPLQAFLRAGQLQPDIRTIITIAVDYFFEDNYDQAGFKVSNYSRFCWNTIAPKANKIIQFLKENGCYAGNMDVPARAAACKSGLGIIGKNCMFYAHGLGSYVGISAIGTDLELPEQRAGEEQAKSPACAKCNKCINVCPTKAISADGYRINPLRCISFINRHADEPHLEMPEDVSRLNRWLHGCEVCQDVCPLNVKIKHKKEIVLSPEINLYGMRLANVATVSQKTLRDNMEHITSAGYLRYVRRLLGEGAQD